MAIKLKIFNEKCDLEKVGFKEEGSNRIRYLKGHLETESKRLYEK